MLTFLPINILEQFSKLANLYFLGLLILEFIPAVSDSDGKIPTLIMPLSFVVGLSMIKDIYEDFKRHVSDNDENNRNTMVGRTIMKPDGITKRFMKRRWRQIKVGQIVKVQVNEYFPCDLILINSSTPKGICYVETKNLDGETNLKHKQASHRCIRESKNEYCALNNFNKSSIECDKENEFIYKFNGQITYDDGEIEPLEEGQILLRGSSLRNTDWIYGVAVYTGHHTKVMMNSSKSR
jgi:magnesium-transporting ATPase (P-type)